MMNFVSKTRNFVLKLMNFAEGVNDEALEDADMGGFFGEEDKDEWDCCETEEEVARKLAAMKLSAACDAPEGFFSADMAGDLPDYAVLELPYDDSYGEGLLASGGGGKKCFMVRRSVGEPNQCMTLSYADEAGEVSHTRIVLDKTQPEEKRLWLRWQDEEYEAKSVELLVEKTAVRDRFGSVAGA